MNGHDPRLAAPDTRTAYDTLRDRARDRWGDRAVKRFERLFRAGESAEGAFEALKLKYRGAAV